MSTRPPTDLRVEHLDDALGIGVREPRFSWKLPPGSTRQDGYRLRVGTWDSGWVDDDANVLVPFDGPPLAARQRVEATVCLRTDLGVSRWTDPLVVELGLLDPDDWVASWISPAADPGGAIGHRPAVVFERTFTLDAEPSRARVYATAHGVYELFLNGRRVGDLELTPGFTSYTHHLQIQTFDVGDLLRTGDNTLGAVVSDGWWRGQVGFTRDHDVWGPELACLIQLEVDGKPCVVTDSTWRTAISRHVEADLIEGQRTDQRRRDADLEWAPVQTRPHELHNLVTSPAPPMRRVEVMRPVTVTELAPGHHVIDVGQNINGWLRLDAVGAAGTELTITHGEMLDDRGDVTTDHLRPVDFATQAKRSAGQVDRVVSDGSSTGFEPRHTVHGFQYARVEGHPGPLTEADVHAVVVHSDLRRTGWFRCSDDRLNRLHEAAVWSFRANACDIPTDCPQRERAGWTGDWQLFSPTASFLYDVAGFSTKWLRDLAADQRTDGAVRNFAPNPLGPTTEDNPTRTFLEASAGWGDAAVLVPWDVHRYYGDRRVLEEQYESMCGWVGYQAAAARNNRHQSRIDRSIEPAPHEQYLWDTGFHWGEWCEPGRAGMDHFADLGRDLGIIATAYFARSTGVLARIARLLERHDDAMRYTTLHEGAVDAWRTEYVDDNGLVISDRQADVVRALAFGLARPEGAGAVADQLAAMVRAEGIHLNTGFLATPFLLPVLADHGHLELAYQLLFQDTPPSWLAMIDRGATTIWENWEGLDQSGEGSLNHYSKGAVISFLHDHIAGIQLLDEAPAYKRFRIAPRPGGPLTWAEATLDSPHGRIESAWRIVGDTVELRVVVPPGTAAEVVLPDGRRVDVGPGTARFRSPPG